jgi:hypothetical protein
MPALPLSVVQTTETRNVADGSCGRKAFLNSRDECKRVEMRFAHLKVHHGFERMRLRGLSGARDEFISPRSYRTSKPWHSDPSGRRAHRGAHPLREHRHQSSNLMTEAARSRVNRPLNWPDSIEKQTFSTASTQNGRRLFRQRNRLSSFQGMKLSR